MEDSRMMEILREIEQSIEAADKSGENEAQTIGKIEAMVAKAKIEIRN